ncbi:MAG: penicillin-binding protein 2 [Candidatus Nomurabacteria bacterium]|jgi:cell division protein FtsI/penicillin-binding protein 2|nr:penicillin-binding protein 2 [Candidatus Nomurabacteria bacterium]
MEEKSKISRVQWLTFGLLLVLAIFVIRLFYIQIIEHDKYAALADQMQISKRTINPERGELFLRDKDGTLVPLVLNQTVYTIFADPTQIKDAGEIRNLVQKVAGGQAITSNFEKLTDTRAQYVVLARQITHTQAKQIREADLAGVGLQTTSRRVYPEGSLAAQTLGFVNMDGEGQYGFEQYLNKELTGEPGILQSVTDVRHIPLTIGAHDVSIPAKHGTNFVLSIDRGVQAYVEHVLAAGLKRVSATKGSAVVMEVNTGRVVAMANLPSYDPASYNKVEDPAVFQNTITMRPYEPGSVIKPFTIGASMDVGSISRHSTFHNTGCVMVAGAKICNLFREADNQTLDVTDILRYSLNTGAIWALEQMGGGEINLTARQRLHDYFVNNYRLTQKTNIELSGEATGLIMKPDNPNGANVTYSNMTFGQGMNVTMIQVVAAFSALINGGTYFQPTLILGTVNKNGELVEQKPKIVSDGILKPEISKNLKEMIRAIRANNTYTAQIDRGYYVGGKSGTAETIDPKTGKYGGQTIGSYLGFIGDETGKPKYAIMVRVDDGRVAAGSTTGSAAAQPIFNEISRFVIEYEGVAK